MRSRLPISLRFLYKLKNEIRQLLYSLYSSKKLKETDNQTDPKKNPKKDPKKNMALANLSIYYTWKNIISEYNDNKSKLSAPTWNDTFDLLDGSYSISDIQDYFQFIIKKHETLTENPPVQIYVNKIKNRNVFKIRIKSRIPITIVNS